MTHCKTIINLSASLLPRHHFEKLAKKTSPGLNVSPKIATLCQRGWDELCQRKTMSSDIKLLEEKLTI
ncbi:hypothetical protein [Desulfopila sp. IMCC35008]|uniref:hypothetical protein n=1 Tax=Desulfopila sp. IMCC35008 TaxID=2653858 RepID=UPI0013D02D72|nr:hypothetical protein [Desulfopila sp. IMCC35008]